MSVEYEITDVDHGSPPGNFTYSDLEEDWWDNREAN